VLLPLVSLAANGFEGTVDTLKIVWTNFAGWSLPYLAGRLYYGDREGPARLIKAIVIAGLASLPIFAFEMVMGPRFYVANLVYGISPYGYMVSRLGGWRPEGFQASGLEVATWLALSATMAAWSWLKRGWPFKASIVWVPPTILMIATIASRGVYGYANYALGLMVAVLTQLTKSRAFLIALAIVPLVYIGSRITGVWDGKSLVDLVQFTGRADTISYRFRAEDAYIKKVLDHNVVLGFGGRDSAIFDWFAQNHLWPDGWWIHQLRGGGLVGLSAALLALFLFPTGLALALPADRSGRASPSALAWGLALFLILHMIDSLQNMNYLTASPLIGGSLVSLFLGRRSSRLDVPTVTPSAVKAGVSLRAPLLVTISVLVVIEILGSLPRKATVDVPSPPGLKAPAAK
jgi:hypothetical protein